ncbi:hypothetical protein T484DRAFT_1949889 [Baffinella frigidus]|nr:hypothetical protein T484DRAFT_1949889 [Cryptophyta sp. CCMP2293]
MDEMFEVRTDDTCASLLAAFVRAHELGLESTGNRENAISVVSLQERRVEVLGRLQRFRDQGEAMCICADYLLVLGKGQEAARYYLRARKIAEAHGFFSVECTSCLGLGKSAWAEGRVEEGMALLRKALVAVPLCEGDATTMELKVLHVFTIALLESHAIDEVEPLVARYREAAKAESEKRGRLSFAVFHGLYASARLQEARGRPHEAAGEVRALLDLMRENESRVQVMSIHCQEMLRLANVNLKILDPELGEEELIQSVAAEMAKLSLPNEEASGEEGAAGVAGMPIGGRDDT